jgi:hypothetical protein
MSHREASELARREKEWQAKFDVAYDLLTVSDSTQCRLLKVPSRDYYAKKLGQALLESDHITDLQLNSTRWSSVSAIKDIEKYLQSTTSLKKFHLRDSYSNPRTARLLSSAARNKHIKEIGLTFGNPARNPSAVLDLLKSVPENALTSLCLLSLTALLSLDADEEAKADVDDTATNIAKSIRAQKKSPVVDFGETDTSSYGWFVWRFGCCCCF